LISQGPPTQKLNFVTHAKQKSKNKSDHNLRNWILQKSATTPTRPEVSLSKGSPRGRATPGALALSRVSNAGTQFHQVWSATNESEHHHDLRNLILQRTATDPTRKEPLPWKSGPPTRAKLGAIAPGPVSNNKTQFLPNRQTNAQKQAPPLSPQFNSAKD
jgi:hypothetical protein